MTAPEPSQCLDALRQVRAERDALRDALERIQQWADAYPVHVFPEPDMRLVDAVLSAAGLSLATVAASNMRHVAKGMGDIARAALQTAP